MAVLIVDDNGVSQFIDDNGVQCFIDDAGNFTFCPSGNPSVTTLVSSINPVSAGQSVIFTATVTPASPVPTGTVQFFDGITSLGAVSLNGLGKASFTFATTALGSHSITAAYGGDVNYSPSTSSALIEIVLPLQYQVASRGKPWLRVVRIFLGCIGL